MAYSSGMLNKRIVVARRAEREQGFGQNGQTRYYVAGSFWAAVDFSRGVKALREGAMDAYDTLMFRMRYTPMIDRWSVIQHQGKWYNIQSFNASEQDNQIQITAQEMAQEPQIV